VFANMSQQQEMMKATTEQNKTLVLEAFETLFNKRDYAAAEKFWSPNWKRWGPYLAERQWATVREDYSANDRPGPCDGSFGRFADNPHWRNHVLFFEYFDGDTGRGLGASHQTGWTALAATLIEKCVRRIAELQDSPGREKRTSN